MVAFEYIISRVFSQITLDQLSSSHMTYETSDFFKPEDIDQ